MAKILVVDDEPEILTLVTRMLTRAGHQVLNAADGRECINLFRAQHPDLVITDVLMPGKEGIETLLEIKREAPQARIIVMSGGGSTGASTYLRFANHLGADATLTKPFVERDLTAAVDRVLAAKHA